ncbi:MAG: GDP-mannose 4,6-dehydratase, partial [Desulfobacterales bacterium]
VTVARLFNTIGPRQTGAYGMVVPRFIAQAIKNDPLTVYGDGNQTRTFTDVKDVVYAFMKMVENEQSFGEVFNLGGVEEITILDLAQKIITLTESRSKIILVPYEEAFGADFEDMLRRVPSIDKAERLIGFQPNGQLDSILKRIISSMEN